MISLVCRDMHKSGGYQRARRTAAMNPVAGISGMHALTPTIVGIQAIRTDLGRPNSSIRFRAFAATATSVAYVDASVSGEYRRSLVYTARLPPRPRRADYIRFSFASPYGRAQRFA